MDFTHLSTYRLYPSYEQILQLRVTAESAQDEWQIKNILLRIAQILDQIQMIWEESTTHFQPFDDMYFSLTQSIQNHCREITTTCEKKMKLLRSDRSPYYRSRDGILLADAEFDVQSTSSPSIGLSAFGEPSHWDMPLPIENVLGGLEIESNFGDVFAEVVMKEGSEESESVLGGVEDQIDDEQGSEVGEEEDVLDIADVILDDEPGPSNQGKEQEPESKKKKGNVHKTRKGDIHIVIKRSNYTEVQTAVLVNWLIDHSSKPYPTERMKTDLCRKTVLRS